MADRDPVAPGAGEPDEAQDPEPTPEPEPEHPAEPERPAEVEEPPVIPDRSSDDRDEGWGGRGEGADRDDDWYERERPPHW